MLKSYLPCFLTLAVPVGLIALAVVPAQAGQNHSATHRWWPTSTEQALAHAGANRAAVLDALTRVPSAQREGMQFLIENMPDSDLTSLSAQFLLDNVSLAYEAFEKAPWKNTISKAVFLNDILPYACLNEARDNSRKMLREKCGPLIAGCKTPGEAAQMLNRKLFPLVNVRYSTERKRPDQAPTETIASGKATCSGLSILLADACRAVGIPARVAGTPLWNNNTGNHTWVEVWDDGWHFTGAAEPDDKGLDHGWFMQNASEAKRDVPEHAIYASSFKKTGLAFPLVWAENIQWVPAVNVTERYVPKAAVADASTSRVLIKVLDANGKRVAVPVAVREVGKTAIQFTGMSRGETADIYDMFSFEAVRVCPAREYEVFVEYNGRKTSRKFKAGANAQEIIEVRLG